MPLLATKYRCTGCMLCGDVCPHSAISFSTNDAYYYPIIDSAKCIDCKLCEKYCPEIVPKLPLKNTVLYTPVVGWINNMDIRKKSASGGAFMAIALAFITDSEKRNVKWNIVGSILENNRSKMKIISRVDDLALFQGTKYSATNTADIYTHTLRALKKGEDVLFSGLPCHINALHIYLNNRHFKGKLLTCDLICNGVPSNKLLQLTSNDISKVISFRDKVDGWSHTTALQYFNIKGELCRETLETNYFLKALCNNFLMRECCYDCKYCTLFRNSDITIGDWWGCSLSEEQSMYGVSLVIPHSDRGIEIVKASDFDSHNIDWHECLPYNPRIFTGKRFIGRLIPNYIKNRINNFSNQTIYRLLTCDYSAKKSINPFWIYYKFKFKILNKIDKRYRDKALKAILSIINNDK